VTATPCFFFGAAFSSPRPRPSPTQVWTTPPPPDDRGRHSSCNRVSRDFSSVSARSPVHVVYGVSRLWLLHTSFFHTVPRPFRFFLFLFARRSSGSTSTPCPYNIILSSNKSSHDSSPSPPPSRGGQTVSEPSSPSENLAGSLYFRGRRSSMVRTRYASEMPSGDGSPQPPAVIWQSRMKSWPRCVSSAVSEMESIRKWFYKPKVSGWSWLYYELHGFT